MVHAVVDCDAIKYAAASAGEKRTIQVIHTPSGRDMEFKTRTEFYGGLKRDGGYLAQINKGRDSPFTLDQFQIKDIQTPEKIENVLHLAKMMMEKWLRAVKADTHEGFLGAGDSWRVGRSTIMEYKGNRKDLLRPIYLDEVGAYLERNYNVRTVRGLEADDWCVIACQDVEDSVMLAIDKDAMGTPCNVYNPGHPEWGITDCNQFGKLYKDEKGKIRGYGRLFLYYQICTGDTIDHYKANSASKMKWGEASGFKALVGCKNDKEAWAAMKAVYQKLYPEPTTVEGWRGEDILVDWVYMLEENFQMARMLRSEDDTVQATDVLRTMGLL
ncbi:hypothetical protein D3C85_737400 [compost metagenome]